MNFTAIVKVYFEVTGVDEETALDICAEKAKELLSMSATDAGAFETSGIEIQKEY